MMLSHEAIGHKLHPQLEDEDADLKDLEEIILIDPFKAK